MKLVTYVGPREELAVKIAGGQTYTFRQGKALPVREEHVQLFSSADFEISSPVPTPAPEPEEVDEDEDVELVQDEPFTQE